MGDNKLSFEIFEKVDVKPDLIEQPSLELIENLEKNRLSKSLKGKILEMALRPTITTVMIRLKKVQILNIHEAPWDKSAEIYLVTSIVDGIREKPITINIKTFNGIKKNDFLDIADPGVMIYENPTGKLPRYLDIRMQIVESDKKIRDTAEIIKTINDNQNFKDIQEILKTLASTANPMLGTVLQVTSGVIPLVGKVLEMNKDDQLCYYVGTFTDKFDNLGIGIHEHTKYNEVKFSYEILAG